MSIYSSKLNVCIVYTNYFKQLAYAACSSYKNHNILVHFNKCNFDTHLINGNSFRTNAWYDSLNAKIAFSNSIFKKMDYDDVILVADADVLCLNSDRVFDLKDEIKDLDMLSQTNHFEQYYEDVLSDRLMVNCGFMAVRKTERSEDFFDKILQYDFSEFYFAEQDIVNEVILRGDHGLKYKTISPTEYILGCYLDRILSMGNLNVSLIHTTCTHNLKEKKDQIDRILKECKLQKINWNNLKITKKEVLYYTNGELSNCYKNIKCLKKIKM